jgi:hypothetical protein
VWPIENNVFALVVFFNTEHFYFFYDFLVVFLALEAHKRKSRQILVQSDVRCSVRKIIG